MVNDVNNMLLLKAINNLGFGEFVEIEGGYNYENQKYGCHVYDPTSFNERLKECIYEEIPYTLNEILSQFIDKTKIIGDIMLNEYKELAKVDPSIVVDMIKDKEAFLVYMTANILNGLGTNSVIDIVYDDSKKFLLDDKNFVVIYEK